MALPKLQFTSTTQRSLSELYRWATEDDGYYPIDLNPAYQRGAVWTEQQKQALIKSILMGLPIGGVFINHRDLSQYSTAPRCVDGQQRIRAIVSFMNGELAVPADWFDDRAEEKARAASRAGDAYPGGTAYPSLPDDFDADIVRWEDLTVRGQRSFKGSTIAVYETALPTEAAEAEMYGLLNFGGTAQTEADRQRAARVAAS
jgi:hypothetical protein